MVKKPTNDYEKSNAIESVDAKRFSTKYFSSLLGQTEDPKKRQKAAQELIDHLSNLYKINSPKVMVTERPRLSNDRGQTYGKYRFYQNDPRGDTIIIYNTTAKTGKPVSIKSFADTLLHEFTHHYDTRYLKIKSAHTAGFYKRISSLKGHLSKEKIKTKIIMNDMTSRPLNSLIATAQGGAG